MSKKRISIENQLQMLYKKREDIHKKIQELENIRDNLLRDEVVDLIHIYQVTPEELSQILHYHQSNQISILKNKSTEMLEENNPNDIGGKIMHEKE